MVKYFLNEELKANCTLNSFYVSLFNDILDLTGYIKEFNNKIEINELLKLGGKDISHLFFKDNDRITLRKNLINNNFIDKLSFEPSENKIDNNIPFWMNPKYKIGRLTVKEKKILIINALTFEKDYLIVPIEETLLQIEERYLKLNSHSKSYTFKDLEGNVLDMTKTLTDNGILDQEDDYDYLEIPEPMRYIPSIVVYYNDDLTEL